jgi:hypothetical protein
MNNLDEQAPSTLRRTLLLVLGCVLALVLPFVLMRQVFGTGDTASPSHPETSPAAAAAATSPAVTATTSPKAATASPAPAALAAEAESCRLANLRQQAPLSAADVSLAQFDKHIDAMNLLVAGKISLSVATTYWDQTRVGAAANAAAFHRADKQLSGNTARCPAVAPAVADAAPYGQVVAIRGCASAITARSGALDRARTAVTTWEHHVHDMEMLRSGHITPAQATAAWNRNWKVGAKQLATYEKAAAQAKKINCSLG